MIMETIERVTPKVGENYPGFCCEGFDYLICLIFPNQPDNYTSIWGRCQNPDCLERQSEDDPYRGVSQNLLDDFEDALEEKGARLGEL
jgi:hypothetical protein